MGADHFAQAKYNQIRADAAADLEVNLAFINVRELTRELFALDAERLRVGGGGGNPKCVEWKNWILAKRSELRGYEDYWYTWWKWGRGWGWPTPYAKTADWPYIKMLNFRWVKEYTACNPWDVPGFFGEGVGSGGLSDEAMMDIGMVVAGDLSVVNAYGRVAIGTIIAGRAMLRASKAAGKFVNVAGKAAIGFKSFRALKGMIGSARAGHELHHIVERRLADDLSIFAPEIVHSTRNVVELSTPLHQTISNYYSTSWSFTGGQTLRKWLESQTFQQQFDFGLEILQRVRAGLPLPH